jgi:hypothetical protein
MTINVLRFQRILSASVSVNGESELAFANTCAALDHVGPPLGKNIALQPADDLAVLAATELINACHHSVLEANREASAVESVNTLHAPLVDTLVLLEQTVIAS